MALLVNISVLEPAIQSHTNAHHCQERSTRLKSDGPRTPRAVVTGGKRSMARDFSRALRYFAVVLWGVSGNAKKP